MHHWSPTRLIVLFMLSQFTSIACQDQSSASKQGTVTVFPNEVFKGDSAVISVTGDAIQPAVRRNISCGSTPLIVDDTFRVRIRLSIPDDPISGIDDANWIPLDNPTWNWENNRVDATLSQQDSMLLSPGLYDIEIQTQTEGTVVEEDTLRLRDDGQGTDVVPFDTNTSPVDSSSDSDTNTGAVSDTDTIPDSDDSDVPIDSSSEVEATELIINEQDGLCTVDGEIKTDYDGYLGTGYADLENSVGNGMEWAIEVIKPGSYQFQWRYANGLSQRRTGELLLNETITGERVLFPTTEEWTIWADTGTTVDLEPGNYVIRLEADTGIGLPNIDQLTIIGPGGTIGDCNPIDGDTDPVKFDSDTSPRYPGSKLKEVLTHNNDVRIDGFFDDWPTWNEGSFNTTVDTVVIDDHTGGATPATATFEIMWTDSGLYFGISVQDSTLMAPPGDNLELGDSVEFYIDVLPTGEDSYGLGDNWLSLDQNGNIFNSRAPMPGVDYGSHTPGGASPGYQLEVYVPWTAINMSTPPAGTILGLDVGINDHDDSSFRDFKLMWNGDEDNLYSTTNFAKMILSSNSTTGQYEEPIWNECDTPRSISINTAELITWDNYTQSTSQNRCGGGTTDVWFELELPGFSSVQISTVSSNDVAIWYKQNESNSCTAYSCEIVQPSNNSIVIANDAETKTILFIISASGANAQTVSYVTFVGI